MFYLLARVAVSARTEEEIDAGPFVLSEEDLVAFAAKWDPQWFHTDAAAAAQSRFGGLIASGWQMLSETFAKSVEDGFLSGSGLSSDGLEDLRWLRPARRGSESLLGRRERSSASRR